MVRYLRQGSDYVELRVSELHPVLVGLVLPYFLEGAGATVRAPEDWPAGEYRMYTPGILERAWFTGSDALKAIVALEASR